LDNLCCPIYCFELQTISKNHLQHPSVTSATIHLIISYCIQKQMHQACQIWFVTVTQGSFMLLTKHLHEISKTIFLYQPTSSYLANKRQFVFKQSKSAKVPQSWFKRAFKICNRMTSSVKRFKSYSNFVKCRFELKIVIPQHQLSGLNNIGSEDMFPM
jgi:hypothetical protein